MKRFDVCLLFLFISSLLFAQNNVFRKNVSKKIDYLLHVGDTITFFPSNPDFKGSFPTDYSCFYSLICLEKGIKPKYRFSVNGNNLTPKSEIEGHYFYVKKLPPADFDKKNKLAYSAILERITDHNQILLAYPSDLTKDMSIINSWMVIGESVGHYHEPNNLVIPYLPKWFIDEINLLEGKTLLLKQFYATDQEDYQMLKAANGETKAYRLSSYRPIEEGDSFIVGKLNFISLGVDLTYLQPYLSITDPRDKYMYRIPVCHFAGNSSKLYILRGEIENLPSRHFVEKGAYIASLKDKGPKMDTLIGRTYYYDNTNYFYADERRSLSNYIRLVDDLNTRYKIKDGYYKCIGFDYFPDKYSKSFFSYNAIFEDNTGVRFTFPAMYDFTKYGRLESSKDIIFSKIFVPKEVKEKIDLVNAKKEEELNRLEAKYGTDVGSSIYYGLCTEDRYAALCKKYGKKKAGLMAGCQYEVGWTYEEFCEIRKPYEKFECIHSYKSNYGTMEVYEYGYTPTYITFRNGKIESISNYY